MKKEILYLIINIIVAIHAQVSEESIITVNVKERAAITNEFPFHVSFQYSDHFRNYFHICSGTLISLRHAATSSNCICYFLFKGKQTLIFAMAGSIYYDKPNGQRRDIIKTYMHELQNGTFFKNDIGIAVMDVPFDRSPEVNYISIGRARKYQEDLCIVPGFIEPHQPIKYDDGTAYITWMHKTRIWRIELLKCRLIMYATKTESNPYYDVDDTMVCGETITNTPDNINMNDIGTGLICRNKLVGIHTGQSRKAPNFDKYVMVFTSVPGQSEWLIKQIFKDQEIDFSIIE